MVLIYREELYYAGGIRRTIRNIFITVNPLKNMGNGLKTMGLLIALLFILFASGCVSGVSENLSTDSGPVNKNTAGAEKNSDFSVPKETVAAAEASSSGSSEKTVVDLRADSDSSSSGSSSEGPKYTAGAIISNDNGDKMLVTVYKEVSNKYCTKPIHYSGSYYYAYKDGSFKELGTNYDYVQSIEKMYPNLVSSNQYVYIYIKDTDKRIGQLFPENDETMGFNGY
jgi:hypothetical protein